MRDVIRLHFDLEELPEERRKRFRIAGSLRRVFTRPTGAEIAAFNEVAKVARRSGSVQATLIGNLVDKVKAGLDQPGEGTRT